MGKKIACNPCALRVDVKGDSFLRVADFEGMNLIALFRAATVEIAKEYPDGLKNNQTEPCHDVKMKDMGRVGKKIKEVARHIGVTPEQLLRVKLYDKLLKDKTPIEGGFVRTE